MSGLSRVIVKVEIQDQGKAAPAQKKWKYLGILIVESVSVSTFSRFFFKFF